MEPIILPIAPVGYRPQSLDCSIKSDLLQFELLRRWSPTQRLMQAGSLMRSARQLSLNAHRQRFPQLSTVELGQKLARTWLQEYCPAAYIPTGTEMTWIQDSIQLAAQLHELFVANDISYYVTEGVAAVAYGETRTTQRMSENSTDSVETKKPKYYNLSSINHEKTEVPGHDNILSYRHHR